MGFFFVFAVWQALVRRQFAQRSKLDGRVVTALSNVCGLFPVGVVVGVASRDITIEWSGELVFVLAVMGLFVGLFHWLAFEASKELSVTAFQTIFQLYAVTAAVGGWMLLGEELTPKQLVGGAMLLAGAVLAAHSHKAQKGQPKSIALSAAALGIIASVSLGIGVTAEKAALDHMSLGAYFVVGLGLQTVASCLIAARQLKDFRFADMDKEEWRGVLMLGVLGALLTVFYIAAVNLADNVSLVSIVTTFQMPLIALAGYVILKEKEVGWKLGIATTVAFVGLVVTAV